MRNSVIVFHSIGDYDTRYDISKHTFISFLKRATESGYIFGCLSDLAHPDKDCDIILTFDDAYKTVVQNALPYMKEYGITGTLFVITDTVGQSNEWNRRAQNRLDHCSWRDIERLLSEGWEIGSHSHRHFNMLSLSNDEILFEIEQSNELIMKMTEVYPDTFAYPYGRFDERIVNIISNYYKLAVATENGGTNLLKNRFSIKRLWPQVLPGEFNTLFKTDKKVYFNGVSNSEASL